MNINKAIRQLKILENTILADRKISYTEALVLKDFIKPYVEAGVRCFVKFDFLLASALADGKINNDESAAIARSIRDVIRRLKVEQIIEYVFFSGIAFGLVIYACYSAYNFFK